eukprot:SAG25_NODE_103_length_15482_cov_9.187415_3_plen_209_part_00
MLRAVGAACRRRQPTAAAAAASSARRGLCSGGGAQAKPAKPSAIKVLKELQAQAQAQAAGGSGRSGGRKSASFVSDTCWSVRLSHRRVELHPAAPPPPPPPPSPGASAGKRAMKLFAGGVVVAVALGSGTTWAAHYYLSTAPTKPEGETVAVELPTWPIWAATATTFSIGSATGMAYGMSRRTGEDAKAKVQREGETKTKTSPKPAPS